MDERQTDDAEKLGKKLALTRDVALPLLKRLGFPTENVCGLTIDFEPAGLVAVTVRSRLTRSEVEVVAQHVADGYRLVRADSLPEMGQQYPHALADLRVALDAAETNEPVCRAEGRIEQADLQALRATDLRAAIRALGGGD